MSLSRSLKWPQIQDGKPLFLLLTLLAFFLFLLFFLIGFFSSFPETVLRDRILAEVERVLPPGNRLDVESVELGFPLTLRMSGARLTLSGAPLSELDMDSVELSPTLATLIGRPGLDISARSALGMLTGTVSGSGDVSLQLLDGRFDLPVTGMEQLHVTGSVSAIELRGQVQVDLGEALRFGAVLDNLSLVGARQLGVSDDVVPLGQLTVALAGTGRSLQFEQLSLIGGVVAVTGSGRLLLQQPLGASRLELDLQLQPNASADTGIRSLLELLGPTERGGVQTLQLRGRLMAPQIR